MDKGVEVVAEHVVDLGDADAEDNDSDCCGI